jgi:hypothetical protein
MNGTAIWRKLRSGHFLALGALFVVGLIAGPAWTGDPNQIEAKKLINVEDKDDISKSDGKIWVLDFKFYAPRLITVDIPGRGRKLCWYMRYQVINNTKDPHLFIPDFELVTADRKGKTETFKDQILPKVQDAVRKLEDPLDRLNLQNSVTIASKSIPPSKPDAAPKAVNGVAIWDDLNLEANRFSIFVSGLSNGWSLAEIPPDNRQIVKKKTLQLNFKRLGDQYYIHNGEIRFVAPEEWVYRATSVTLPAVKSAAEPAKQD